MLRLIRWLKVDLRVHIRIQRKTSCSNSSSLIKIRIQGKPIHICLSSIVKIQIMESQYRCNRICMEAIHLGIVRISIIKRPVNLILRVNFSLDPIRRASLWVIIMHRQQVLGNNKETSVDNTATTNQSDQCQTLLFIINKLHKIHRTFFKDLITEE